MLVTIDGPVFYGQADEDHFFKWLGDLPSFGQVVGVGRELAITLREPVDDETTLGLLVLCERWQISMKPLRALCTQSNQEWFASPQSWFHGKVWGKAATA